MRTIRVTGKGRLKVKPDMTRITLTLEGVFPEYGEALKKSSEDTESLRDLLTDYGFEPSDLKTLNFNVETEYESYKSGSSYKQRFVGYRYHHLMKVEFASDNVRLGKVLYALAHCSIKPEFRLSYTVKDPEAAKNRLLGTAIEDAREKSAVLTQAANVTLKEIQSIDYSWDQINFEVRPMDRMLMMEDCKELSTALDGSYDLDIEPDDLEVSDTVTVIWEIERSVDRWIEGQENVCFKIKKPVY